MSIILKETRLTLAELAERENVHPATVWRWIAVGIRGVRLESISIGGRRVTSDQAFARWVSAQNGTDHNVQEPGLVDRDCEAPRV